ncbi:hypothetical protein L6R52_38255, partial [Myxococcota bacterium]|nr:hypothetical protein [Myxococcota bacterium]
MQRSIVRGLTAALGALLFVAASSRGAGAQPAKVVDALKARGFKSFKEGNYAAGIADMEAAYRLAPHPEFLFNIAVAYDLWGGHCDASLESYRLFFRVCGDCSARAVAEERAAATEKKCAEALGAAAVEVTIATTVHDARLQLAGAPIVLTAPATLRLPTGRHTVWVTTDGRTEAVAIHVGTRPARIELALETPRPRPRLVVRGPLTGDVYLDGALVEALGVPIVVVPGRHTVEVRVGASIVLTEDVEVADGQTFELDLGPPRAPPSAEPVSAVPSRQAPAEPIVGAQTIPGAHERPLPSLVWIGAGAAVAGLVVGAVFGVETLGDLDREEAARGEALVSARVVQDAQDDATRHAILAQVGVGVAVAGAALAIAA